MCVQVLGVLSDNTKAMFARCPRLLLVSKATLVKRAKDPLALVGGDPAARQLLARDASVSGCMA